MNFSFARGPKLAFDAKSRNEGYGATGTLITSHGASVEQAAKRFGSLASQISSKFGLSSTQARDYLDSRNGRHLVDEIGMNGDVTTVGWVANSIRDFLRTYNAKEFSRSLR
jgi:hypothetical protein